MLNDNAKKWVAALRSGKFLQTDGYLTRLPDGRQRKARHCCLGVACELAIADGVAVKAKDNEIEGTRRYGNHGGDLPKAVQTWLGLKDSSGAFVNERKYDTSLASLNDDGSSFKAIAKVIESEPEGLFK